MNWLFKKLTTVTSIIYITHLNSDLEPYRVGMQLVIIFIIYSLILSPG